MKAYTNNMKRKHRTQQSQNKEQQETTKHNKETYIATQTKQ